jgi:hypothetical protein
VTPDWPVTFLVEDGRRFMVTRPAGPVEPADTLLVHVDGQTAPVAMGSYLGEQTAGAVIGRTLRWWYEETREPVVLAKPGGEAGGR